MFCGRVHRKRMAICFFIAILSCVSTVLCQSSFQVTSVNGQPVSGSAFVSNNFGTSANFNAQSQPPSSFAITNINGRPVSTGQGGALLNTNRIRVEVELVRLDNPKSLMWDGRFCDTTSKCDPRISVDLDLVRPLLQFPGGKPLSTFQNILEVTNQDSFDIHRIVAKDSCADVTAGNLRVQIDDIDDVTQPDMIGQYDCGFNIGRVNGDALSATWSAVTDCRSLVPPSKPNDPPQTRLTFRHREYAVQPSNTFSTSC